MQVPGRVTIAIPTLNRSKLALRAVESALAQTYSDIEVIVSDDASTDDTVAQLRRIENPKLVLFAQKERLGIVKNFDFCLRGATGEFFLIMGDDDLLESDAIAKLSEPFYRKSPPWGTKSVGMSWCPCKVADDQGVGFWVTENGPPFERVSSLLAAMFAGNRGPRCSSILLRTADAISVGGYEDKYGDLSDIGNWARAALLNDIAVCVSEPLVQYTMHHGSTTSGSKIEKWQNWARLVHSDLLLSAAARSDVESVQELKTAKRDFISGITLTILIQTIGKPGWIRNAALQSLRTPGAVFTPYMLRRLIKDGGKVFTLNRKVQICPPAAGNLQNRAASSMSRRARSQ